MTPTEQNTVTTQHVHWDLHYDVHLGAVWGRFMNGLGSKKIYANECGECQRVFVPPQPYCESCFVPTADWAELPQTGAVEVFTIAWQGFTGGPTPPYVIAGIRLDGASTMLMHYIGGIELGEHADVSDRLEVGARVEAVWAEERTGQILDIAHFRIVETESNR